MGNLSAHLHAGPHRAQCSAVSDQKLYGHCAPPSLFTQSLPKRPFFISLDEKYPQREIFCHCGGGETKKMAEALKDIKIDEFKNCF